MASGLSAVASRRMTIADVSSAGLRLGTPLLLVEGTGCAFLDAGSAKETPSAREDYPYDRLAFSPVAGEIPRSAKKVLAVVPYTVPGIADPDVTLSAHLIDAAGGRRLPVAFSMLTRVFARTAVAVSLEFPVESLAPGRYILYVNAEERTSKFMAHSQTSLVIKGD